MNLISNILYVVEPGVAQETAMARAVSLARNNQASLTAIAVLPAITTGADGPITAQLQKHLADEQRKALEELVAPYREQLEIKIELLEGKLYLEAIRAVLHKGYDLLVKPAENPATIQRLFGSDDMHLLRKCPCPVWLMKPGENPNYANIVAAVDFDPWKPDTIKQPLNRQILKLAASLALSDFTTLHLAHAWEAFAEETIKSWSDQPASDIMEYVKTERSHHQTGLEKLAMVLHERIGEQTYDYLSPRLHLPKGPARRVIPELVRELQADLVVMGTVARTGIPGFIIGNTAEAILDQLTCSVLAVKPPGFVSPVPLTE